jgi:hypothetical protein
MVLFTETLHIGAFILITIRDFTEIIMAVTTEAIMVIHTMAVLITEVQER